VNYEFLNVNYLIVNFEFLIQFVGGIELLKISWAFVPSKKRGHRAIRFNFFGAPKKIAATIPNASFASNYKLYFPKL
jgi:hypothetical protein